MDVLLNLLRGLFGMSVLLLVIYLLSENRRAISWRTVGMAIVLQFTFAALVLYFSPARAAIEWIGGRFIDLLAFTNAGVSLLFGSLADKSRHGVVFAVMILPSIIFFSALSSLLYYLGILQRVVYGFAWVMSKTLRLSGAETLSASANIFLGQTEAPFLVKPYLAGMTRSEMLTIMVGGMATIAGAVMMAYIAFLGGDDPKQQMLFATHLITASVINAPAGLMIAKMLVPQTQPVDQKLAISKEKLGCNAVDAVCLGTTEGLKLAANVGAMLIAFTALVTMVNAILGWIGTPGTLLLGETRFSYPGLNAWVSSVTGGAFPGLSLEFLFGVLYAPVAWLIGIDHGQLLQSGALLGTRTVLNEFIAFQQLGTLKAAGAFPDSRAAIILTYAMCGFANIVSIGIQIGGIGALAPEQRTNLAQLGVRAMIGGTVACYLSACVASILV